MDSSFQFLVNLGMVYSYICFNPCFNGFFFSMGKRSTQAVFSIGFNPCFNGFFFSILKRGLKRRKYNGVSILVLMDSSFQSDNCFGNSGRWQGFNPCFNGFFFSIFKNRPRSMVIYSFQSLF